MRDISKKQENTVTVSPYSRSRHLGAVRKAGWGGAVTSRAVGSASRLC